MECLNCNNKKLKKIKRTHNYKECGLNNVVLKKVEFHVCSKCGSEYTNFGGIDKVHKLISQALLEKKALLTGQEIGFLRRELGLSKKIFAGRLGCDEETVRRWEAGKHISTSTDRLIRMFVTLNTPDLDHETHDKVAKSETNKNYKFVNINVNTKVPILAYA